LGRVLADEPIAAVYSSDLGRSMDTARAVAAPHGLEVRPAAGLREVHVGGFTGKSQAEIDEAYPGLRHRWATEPASLRLPDGETLAEAQARALAFFAERMPAHLDQTLVMITHGAVAQTILVEAMGGKVEDLWLKQRIDNCQISRLEWTPSDSLQVIEYCDVRHLQDVGSLRGWRTTGAA
jgi:broad specificity phosphatase PhoE